MSKRYAWSKRSFDEYWRGGPCDSIKECVEEALDDGYEIGDNFAIGLIEDYNPRVYFADLVIEALQEDAYDEVGEVAEDWLDYISPNMKAELENRLQKVISEWLELAHETPTFYKINPIKTCTLSEALEIHSEITEITPKGGKYTSKEGI